MLAADLSGELQARLGVALPVRALRYWVLGVPDPAMPATEHLGSLGLPDWFEQDGWRVQFGRYGDTALGVLPVRIAAERAGARIRLAIDDWGAGPGRNEP
jgi:outer membrane lipoprotein LolB